MFASAADFLLILTWGQGLFELLSLLLVCDDQGVQVSAAAHLEFNIVLVLLDLYGLGILPPGGQQEIFDFFDLARHVGCLTLYTSNHSFCQSLDSQMTGYDKWKVVKIDILIVIYPTAYECMYVIF